MSHSYQLTQYPVGSVREFWTLSWPLMLGLISSTLMIFTDRLFLAHLDPLALNAAASGGMAYYMFLVIPMSIATISEILVGRLNGESQFSKIGSATWQMVWFSVILIPLFFLISWAAPFLLFRGSGNEAYEADYFSYLMYFAPAQCAMIAFAGFFIGTGHVKIVTVASVVGNLANVGLDYLLIFGISWLPALGVKGVAIATGLSQVLQILIYLAFFLTSHNRMRYKTADCSFNRHFFIEGITIGAPSGAGHCIEILGHFLFFRIVTSVGTEQMTIVVMVQSFYILASFIVDAQSKAAGSIIANLLGAEVLEPIRKVLKSSFLLHTCYTLLFAGIIYFFAPFFFQTFSAFSEQQILPNANLIPIFVRALFFMCLFFLFDGFTWILIGFLTASGDTKFIFWVSAIVHWVVYVIPTLWFVGFSKGGADVAWSIVAFMSVINVMIYLWRYVTGKWLKAYHAI